MRGVNRSISGTVKVYRFRMYEIASDKFKVSSRMATYACIKRINARPIKGTEIEIDKVNIDGDGITTIGFEIPVFM
jgi:predicted RNA-binding protein